MGKKLLTFILVFLLASIAVNFTIRLTSSWSLADLDEEGIQEVIYDYYDRDFPSWPLPANAEEAPEGHNISIGKIVATEVVEQSLLDGGNVVVVFHENEQNGHLSFNVSSITRPLANWWVSSSVSSLDLMLEQEPVSFGWSAIPNAYIYYGLINVAEVEQVLVSSDGQETSFQEATIIDVELSDGSMVGLYYLVSDDTYSGYEKVIALNSEGNVIE